MNQKQTNRIIKLLNEKGISFDRGLTDIEVEQIKNHFGVHFPEDLKRFLQTGLPVSAGFVHWRYGIQSEKGKQEIQNRLYLPLEGMLFDIKNNAFWLDQWGKKPTSFEEQKKIAVSEIAKQPRLIPVYSHRYIAAEPDEVANPVFSVHQMDIIYYGNDLMDYFSNEFKIEVPKSFGTIHKPKRIRFWSDRVDHDTKITD